MEADGCWSKQAGEPRKTGPKPQIANVEADWTVDEPPPSDAKGGGILRSVNTFDRPVFALDDDDDAIFGISDDYVVEELIFASGCDEHDAPMHMHKVCTQSCITRNNSW